jgi:hypothetical protein
MSQGTWRVLTKNYPVQRVVPVTRASTSATKKPSTSQQETEEEADETSITAAQGPQDESDWDYEKRKEDWEEQNSKAVGCIRLRLHHSIAYKFNTKDMAGELWDAIKDEYGAPGTTAVYLEFKSVLDMPFPPNVDPSVILDKMGVHFGRMEESKVPIPEYLKCMIVMSKLPTSMDTVAQMLAQRESDPLKMKMELIRKMLAVAWEQRLGKNQKNNQAHRISAVKRGPETPGFRAAARQ